jgi:hypothetical protein
MVTGSPRARADDPAAEPIRFAGATLDRHRHVCAFFDSAAEEDRVMLPFVREGVERGEKAFHIIDPADRNGYLDRLRGGGIAVDQLLEIGRFELRSWHEAYLRGGRFDQDAMLALIQEVLDDGRERGFPLTRLVAHMEWALEDFPGVDDLVEYETRLNYVLPRYRDPVI